MKKEVNGYYRRNGVFVKGHFKTGKPDLLPPDEYMCDHYPKKEDEFLPSTYYYTHIDNTDGELMRMSDSRDERDKVRGDIMICPYCKEGFMIDVGLYPIIKCNACGKVKIDYHEELFKKEV